MENKPVPHLALVIEDEVPLAAIYTKALESAGYRVLEIYDGQAAMDCLSTLAESPSLVVLDLNLPLIPGREILRTIRAEPRFDSTRVILATSQSAAIIGETEANSDLVLFKPISFTQLRDLAARLY